MKEKYTELEAEVISFAPNDVIATSNGGASGDTSTQPVQGSSSSFF